MADKKSYVRDIKVNQKEFEESLHKYIETKDAALGESLFKNFFTKLCLLVLYKLNIADSHPLFEDICQQAMYLCFMAIKNNKYDINIVGRNSFSYFYTIIQNETLQQLKRFHRHNRVIKYSEEIFNPESQENKNGHHQPMEKECK